MLPNVAECLAGQNVLVTGVTGFVGLALVEKLLRSVPDIGTIYVLIRPKRGKTMEERLALIKGDLIFETLIAEGKESALNKLVALAGTFDVEKIGLSDEDMNTIVSNVNYVFHCAATLDFEASLKTTVEINLLGTREIVNICKNIRNLKALVQVSSAYTNSDKKEAQERLYPAPGNVESVVELVSITPEEQVVELTPSILGNHPNTYTFTKALAEHEVANAFPQVPSCIVRPSMIVGAWREPVPGWTNSKNGPQGFIMGAAMGVVRRLPVGKHLIYDYIPVDVVINTMIVGAVHVATNKSELTSCPIFQCTTSTSKPFRWVDVEPLLPTLLHKYPLAQAVWYPYLKLLPSIPKFRISAYLFHLLPAYIFDFIAKMSGGRPKLVRLHTAVNQSLDRLEPFIFQEWHFDNSKTTQLHKTLTPKDQEVFGVDVGQLEWQPFFDDMSKGVRRYLHKEKDSTLKKAIKKDKILFFANITVQILFFFLIFLLLKGLFGVSNVQCSSIVSFLYVIYFLM